MNKGFDACYSVNLVEPFWLTLNKLTISDSIPNVHNGERIYFYIDFRDCGYSNEMSDITIRFDDSEGAFFHSGLSQRPTNEFTEISEGDTINIWEINNYPEHDISCFIPDPTGLDIDDSGTYPELSWNHDQDANGIYGYEIWRLINSSPHPSGTFSLLTTLNDPANLEFTDYGVTLGSGQYAHYKIRAKIDDLLSGYTPVESVGIGGIQKPIVAPNTNRLTATVTEFKLYDNHPDPFNPETTIRFDLPQDVNVELTVYDNSGVLITYLINSFLTSGNYKVKFDASGLSSGTYYFKIVAGKYSQVKRMLLVK